MRICRAATKIVHPWHLSTYTEPLTGPQSTVQFVSSSSRNAPKLSHLKKCTTSCDEKRAGVARLFELTGRRRSRRALEGGNPARARPRRARSRWRTSTRSLRGRETPPEPKQAAPTLAPALRALASRCLRRQSTPTQRPASSGWPRSVPGSSSAGCRTQTSCAVQVVPWPRQSACSAR